jgi:drug/metabolite transporter (DMT)-like permease
MPDSNPLNLCKTVLYTFFALVAFAANSVLCRLALEMQVDGPAIDAGSFTAIRLISGIVALLIILQLTKSSSKSVSSDKPQARGSWFAAAMLFIYAAGFSYAYISLETGTGALILFGVVQMTMIAVSIYSGNRLHYTEWLGVAFAFIGFVYLMLPGVSAPSLHGLILMTFAGVAWGYYTLAGKGSKDPLGDTSFNFLRTLPFVIVLIVLNFDKIYLTEQGIYLAIASGAITSGMGYTIWYIALRSLQTMQAAVLQLLVPVIAALGGVLFVDELLTTRIIVSALLILGGILLVVVGKKVLSAKA